MRVYLASPLFNGKQKERIIKAVNFLRGAGADVFSPMEFEVEDAWSITNPEWAKKVFDHDVKGLDDANVVIAIYEGMDSDTGTSWEIGYAAAKKKDIIILTTNPADNHSLMVVNSCVGVYLYEHLPIAWDNYMERVEKASIENFTSLTSAGLVESPFIPSSIYQS